MIDDKETMIGCGVLLFVAACLMACIAIGIMHGAQYGLLLGAATCLLAAVFYIRAGSR